MNYRNKNCFFINAFFQFFFINKSFFINIKVTYIIAFFFKNIRSNVSSLFSTRSRTFKGLDITHINQRLPWGRGNSWGRGWGMERNQSSNFFLNMKPTSSSLPTLRSGDLLEYFFFFHFLELLYGAFSPTHFVAPQTSNDSSRRGSLYFL